MAIQGKTYDKSGTTYSEGGEVSMKDRVAARKKAKADEIERELIERLLERKDRGVRWKKVKRKERERKENIKKRSEKDSGRLYRAWLKVLDSDFPDLVGRGFHSRLSEEYNKFEKLAKETQIPQDKLEKIKHYSTTTPRGEQRYIDIYQYWDKSTYAEGGGDYL